MTKVKQVFSPDMVAHKWANKQQESARNTGNTLYFDGDSIFSYGRHFCVAKHVVNESTRERAVLFTTRSYSNTTAKHIRITEQAARHLNIIYCNDPADSPLLNIESFEKQIKSALSGLLKAKKPEKYIQPAERIQAQAKKYADFFGVELPASIFEIIETAKGGTYKEYLAKEANKIKMADDERRRIMILKAKKELSEWRTGKGQRLWMRLDNYDYLRINKLKDRIETSQAAEIPIELAKRIYKTIVKIIKSGGCSMLPDNRCALQILGFDVTEITKDYIKVGCHTIDMKEVNKMAKKIGVAV